jgi:hypothetical protein
MEALLLTACLSCRRCSFQSLCPPFRNNVKDTTIKRRPDILFHHLSIFRPEHKIRRAPCLLLANRISHIKDPQLTLKSRSTPPNDIVNIPQPLEHLHPLPKRQIPPAFRILRKNLLKLLRHKASFIIIRARIAAMFRPAHID